MFVSAIDEISQFTRAYHSITRKYKKSDIHPGSGTLFFVNEIGTAITCKHLTDVMGARVSLNETYSAFKKERNALQGSSDFNKRLKDLERKYKFTTESIVDAQDLFLNVTGEANFNYHWIAHTKYDLSILQFEDFKTPLYSSYAVFPKDDSELKPGRFLCRYGYPFPEFTNYRYDSSSDAITFTLEGRVDTPPYPIEGMMTRFLADEGKIVGIEVSTPGLRGQSGGPLFTKEGLVVGMQYFTRHLHLGFDIKNKEIVSDGTKVHVTNQPFLHVGHCIHMNVIKEFLMQNNVKYYEK